MMEEKKDDAEILRLEGNEHFKKADYKGALALYTESLEKRKTVASLTNRAQTYIMLKSFYEAIDDCDTALKMESDNFKAHGRKGIASHAIGRFEIAMKELAWCLEIQPTDKRFQQLFDECQKALDAKNFVNMTLIISSYNGREMDLSVSEPLFNLNIRLIQPVKHFKTLDSLRTYLVENIPTPLGMGTIQLNEVTVDEILMQFFRSLNPRILRTSNLECFNVNCSKSQFDELFGGTMFATMGMWFYQHDDASFENHFLSAIKSKKLPAITDVKTLNATLIPSDLDRIKVPFTGLQRPSIDSWLDFVHTDYPGIPAHIRRANEFCKPPRRTNLDILDGIELVRSFAGRMLFIDLRYLGFGKLQELIDKCTQRFLIANHPIAYHICVRFMYNKERFDRNDAMSLSQIIHQHNGRHVLRNEIGEQLLLFIRPDSSYTIGREEPKDESALSLIIERLFCENDMNNGPTQAEKPFTNK